MPCRGGRVSGNGGILEYPDLLASHKYPYVSTKVDGDGLGPLELMYRRLPEVIISHKVHLCMSGDGGCGAISNNPIILVELIDRQGE